MNWPGSIGLRFGSVLLLKVSSSILPSVNLASSKKIINVFFLKKINYCDCCFREHSSVGRDMHCYMQGLGFKPQIPHLFTLCIVICRGWGSNPEHPIYSLWKRWILATRIAIIFFLFGKNKEKIALVELDIIGHMKPGYSKIETYPYQIRIGYRYSTDTCGYASMKYRN